GEPFTEDCYVVSYMVSGHSIKGDIPLKSSYRHPDVFAFDMDADGTSEIAIIYTEGRGTAVAERKLVLFAIQEGVYAMVSSVVLSKCELVATNTGSATACWSREYSFRRSYEDRPSVPNLKIVVSRIVVSPDTELDEGEVVTGTSLLELEQVPPIVIAKAG